MKPLYYSWAWILETHAGKGQRTGKVTGAHAEASKLWKPKDFSQQDKQRLSDALPHLTLF